MLNNFYEGSDGNIYIRDLEEVNFNNCIIYGSLTTEISFQQEESGLFNYNFNHCLLKIDPSIDTDNNYYQSVILNQSPAFSAKLEDDFNLKANSPAVNTGSIATDGTLDIIGNIRLNADMGAYEYIE